VTLPGLDYDRRYAVRLDYPAGEPWTMQKVPSGWGNGPLVLSGAALGHSGVRLPALGPSEAMVIRVEEEGNDWTEEAVPAEDLTTSSARS
jgi:hypothetical protein